MITDEVKNYINKSVLCWLATIDCDYMPNVSPKELFAFYDQDTLIIANIASPNSEKNILFISNVCVSFVDVFVQKGYKLKGKAVIHSNDSLLFEVYSQTIRNLFGDKFPFSTIIEIKVNTADKIIAPSYFLFSETTEDSQIKAAMKMYRVKP